MNGYKRTSSSYSCISSWLPLWPHEGDCRRMAKIQRSKKDFLGTSLWQYHEHEIFYMFSIEEAIALTRFPMALGLSDWFFIDFQQISDGWGATYFSTNSGHSRGFPTHFQTHTRWTLGKVAYFLTDFSADWAQSTTLYAIDIWDLANSW